MADQEFDWNELTNTAAIMANMFRACEKAEVMFRAILVADRELQQKKQQVEALQEDAAVQINQLAGTLEAQEKEGKKLLVELDKQLAGKTAEIESLDKSFKELGESMANLETEYAKKIEDLEPDYQAALKVHREKLDILDIQKLEAQAKLQEVNDALASLKAKL